jgi:ABC-type lipoprotein export system ATPase subunit
MTNPSTIQQPKNYVVFLDQVSLERNNQLLLQIPQWGILEGEWAYFLGENGAGKTSLLHLILGDLQAQQGHLQILGENPSSLSPSALAQWRRKIGWISPAWAWLPQYAVSQNWDFILSVMQWQDEQRRQLRIEHLRQILPFAHDWADLPFHQLQRQQQALALIGRALLNQPSLILVDDLDLGLSPEKAQPVWDFLYQYTRKQAITTVVATNNPQMPEHWRGTVFYLSNVQSSS